jgi:hypothetical protein
MTPDSGYYPSAAQNASSICSSIDLPIDSNNLSYIKYINTFAMHSTSSSSSGSSAPSHLPLVENSTHNNPNSINSILSSDEVLALATSNNAATTPSNLVQLSHEVLIVPDQSNLSKLNVFELNELIEQIENTISNLSDTLVAVRANTHKNS